MDGGANHPHAFPSQSNNDMNLQSEKIKEGAKLHPLYSQDGKHGETVVFAKFFRGAWTWYATEGEINEAENDITFFGLIVGHVTELGYFTARQLASVDAETDLYFEPCSLNDVARQDSYVKDYITRFWGGSAEEPGEAVAAQTVVPKTKLDEWAEMTENNCHSECLADIASYFADELKNPAFDLVAYELNRIRAEHNERGHLTTDLRIERNAANEELERLISEEYGADVLQAVRKSE